MSECPVSGFGHFTTKEVGPDIQVEKGLAWHGSQSGRLREKKKPLPLRGIEPQLLGRLPHSLVTTPTEVTRIIDFNKQYFVESSTNSV